jgi:hypothetical protein
MNNEMKKGCPLPIDWLEFVEDEDDSQLQSHLESCLSCQALVTALRQEASADELGDWLLHIDLGDAVTFQPKRIERPTFGDFVLSATSYANGDLSYDGQDRLVFLVLDNGHEREGRLWFRVAPAATDVENATSTDLVLRPSENELATPWRVLFAHQTVLNATQLDEWVGALTEAGKEVLRQALVGELGDNRFGTELEGPTDPRMIADRPIEALMRTLRAPFFAVGESEEVATETEAVVLLGDLRQAVADRAADDDAIVEGEGELVPFRRLFDYTQRLFDANLPKAMAAAMETSEDASFWRLESDYGAITAVVSYDLFNDKLLFIIEELHNFASREIALVVWGQGRRRQFESEPFRPRQGETVVLVEQQGFLDRDVEELAAKVR